MPRTKRIKLLVIERQEQALRLVLTQELQKALLRSALIELMEEYISECAHNEGDEYWTRCSVEDHLNDFGLYVQYSTE